MHIFPKANYIVSVIFTVKWRKFLGLESEVSKFGNFRESLVEFQREKNFLWLYHTGTI